MSLHIVTLSNKRSEERTLRDVIGVFLSQDRAHQLMRDNMSRGPDDKWPETFEVATDIYNSSCSCGPFA